MKFPCLFTSTAAQGSLPKEERKGKDSSPFCPEHIIKQFPMLLEETTP